MRLVRHIKDPFELQVVADEGRVYELDELYIDLATLEEIMNKMDGCCMDDENDRLNFLEACVKASEVTGR